MNFPLIRIILPLQLGLLLTFIFFFKRKGRQARTGLAPNETVKELNKIHFDKTCNYWRVDMPVFAHSSFFFCFVFFNFGQASSASVVMVDNCVQWEQQFPEPRSGSACRRTTIDYLCDQ